jgi:hypothetical protein
LRLVERVCYYDCVSLTVVCGSTIFTLRTGRFGEALFYFTLQR